MDEPLKQYPDTPGITSFYFIDQNTLLGSGENSALLHS
jgi:hypothetical protein